MLSQRQLFRLEAWLIVVLAVAYGVLPSSASPEAVTLAWDPNPDSDVQGYRLYVGPESGNYGAPLQVGGVSSIAVDLEPGDYYAVVTAFDDLGLESAGSDELSFSVIAGNVLPEVSLTSPAGGSQFDEQVDIILTAEASDSDGSIAKVEFYAGTTKLGEDLVAPYSFAWSGATPGNYSLIARAVDDAGLSADSPAIMVSVDGGSSPVTYSATLAWDMNPEPDVTGYRLRFGTASGSYGPPMDVGGVTTWTLSDLPAGTYYTAVAAYNASGLESSDSGELVFSVPVLPDTTGPIISGVPVDIAVTPDVQGGYEAIVSWIEPSASDDSGLVSLTSSHLPGDVFSAGVTTVVYTAEDGSGNTSSAEFTITVGSIDIWRSLVFASDSGDETVAGNGANPDGDAWGNLGEYALGLDPAVSDGGDSVYLTFDQNSAEFHVSHMSALPDLSLCVESFEPPGSVWVPVATKSPGGAWVTASDVVVVDVEKDGVRDKLTVRRSISGKQGAFFRFRVVAE